MASTRFRTVALVAIPVIAIGRVFVLDLFNPLGISDWVWYFIPLLLSVYVSGRAFPHLARRPPCSRCSWLGDYFLSPPGINPHLAMFSRLMGGSVLWVMAFVIWQRKQADEEVRKLSLAVEHSPVSIIITDKAGNTNTSTRSSWSWTGYSGQGSDRQKSRILKSGEKCRLKITKRLWETIRRWRGVAWRNFTTGRRTANFIGVGFHFPALRRRRPHRSLSGRQGRYYRAASEREGIQREQKCNLSRC